MIPRAGELDAGVDRFLCPRQSLVITALDSRRLRQRAQDNQPLSPIHASGPKILLPLVICLSAPLQSSESVPPVEQHPALALSIRPVFIEDGDVPIQLRRNILATNLMVNHMPSISRHLGWQESVLAADHLMDRGPPLELTLENNALSTELRRARRLAGLSSPLVEVVHHDRVGFGIRQLTDVPSQSLWVDDLVVRVEPHDNFVAALLEAEVARVRKGAVPGEEVDLRAMLLRDLARLSEAIFTRNKPGVHNDDLVRLHKSSRREAAVEDFSAIARDDG